MTCIEADGLHPLELLAGMPRPEQTSVGCTRVDDDLHRRLCVARRKLAEDDPVRIAVFSDTCGNLIQL
jgi:hypothetical protein